MSFFLDELRDHAINTAWSKPYLDRHLILRPTMQTNEVGVTGVYRNLFTSIALPEKGTRFLIYSLGQLGQKRYGIDRRLKQWVSLSDLSTSEDLNITVHFDSHIVTNHVCHILRDENNHVFLAVERDSIKDVWTPHESLYIRFYQNSWYTTTAGQASSGVTSYGITIAGNTDVVAVINRWGTMSGTGNGHAYCIINGTYRNTISAQMIEVGDRIELIHDDSVDTVFDIRLNDVEYYSSDADSERKTIIMTPDVQGGDFTYHDDIDIYLCQDHTDGSPHVRGIYYGRFTEAHYRQLTRQDWAIMSQAVLNITARWPETVTYARGFFRIVRRRSVQVNNDIHNKNLTHDFFMLSFDDRRNLLVGTGAVIPEWHAKNLETSGFMQWTSAIDTQDKDPANVFSYYGTVEVLETARFKSAGVFFLPTSLKLKGGRLIFTNAAGLRIGEETLTADEWTSEYVTSLTTAVKCQVVPGDVLSTAYNLDRYSFQNGEVPTNWNETRLFRHSGSNEWKIAKYGIDWTIENDVVKWQNVFTSADRIVRSSDSYVRRELTITREDLGRAVSVFPDGSTPETGVGFEFYMAWCNNRRLVRGIDFIVDFPFIYFTCEEWMNSGTDTSDIIFIGCGVGEERAAPDWGFVEERVVSHDDRFNLHMHRLKEFVVDGLDIPEQDMAFAEGYSGSSNTSGELASTHREGAIYSIEKPMTYLSDQIWGDLGTNYAEAIQKDSEIEDYLTHYYAQTPVSDPVIITHKHTVVSPLMRRLIDDMRSGSLEITRTNISDVTTSILIKPYQNLVAIDPCRMTGFDFSYLQVSAHVEAAPIILTVPQFNFLKKVNSLYLNDLIVMNDHFTV